MKKSLLLLCLIFSLSSKALSITMEGASWDDLQDEYITLRLDALADNKGFMAYVMHGEEQHMLLSPNSTEFDFLKIF